MKEEHRYFIDGYELKRIFVNPNAAFDTVNIDPFSSKDYVKVTGKSKDTIGSLFDRSKELSLKREQKLGHSDPQKQAYFNDYAKKRRGKRSMEERKDNLDKILKEEIQLKLK